MLYLKLQCNVFQMISGYKIPVIENLGATLVSDFMQYKKIYTALDLFYF